jgi:D-alanyl-D-alanine endopeptidase (penicillin-binding protein 7)
LGPTVLIAAIASVQAALIPGNVAASTDNVLSLAAWPLLATSRVSSVADTAALGNSQGLVSRRMVLPGAQVSWSIRIHRQAAAAPKLQYGRSNRGFVVDYLHPRECAVESDGAAGLDDFALLAPLPSRRAHDGPLLRVAKAKSSFGSDAIPLVRGRPGATATPVSIPVPVGDAPPLLVDASPVVNPNLGEADLAVSVTTFDIKELDQESAERFARLRLTSAAALVVDQHEGNLLFAKNPDAVRSIASITKLMTAMVALDARLPLDERLTVEAADVAIAKGKVARLKVGVSLTRREMFKLALMSSENRAAAALARTYPGGLPAFVEAMNGKAAALGMTNTRFLEPTGLDSGNVSTAHDLALMVNAAYAYPLIREFTTSDLHEVPTAGRRHRRAMLTYRNSNRLVRDSDWEVGLSKTGYIGKAGRCLVMQATIAAKPMIIVLLDSVGKVARLADANRIKHWLEGHQVAISATARIKPGM